MSKPDINLPGSEALTFETTDTGSLPPIFVGKSERFTISARFIAGTGTVDMERRLPGDAEGAYRVVESYTVDTEKDGIATENMELRMTLRLHGGSGDIRLRLGG